MPTKKRIQYRYTPTGQRSLLIDPDGGRFTYSYDSVKRLTQVLNPQGQRTTFGYDNAGRRTVKRLASGSRTSFSYDLASRLTSVAQLKSDASVQAQYQYKYDKVGNRTAMAESGHTTARTTWSYDAAYQLTGEHRTGANPYRNTYTYDTRGNRTLKNLDGVRTTSSYDAANQLKWTDDGSGRTTYTFDPDGNQQVVLTPAGQRTTSVWDYENKLTGVLYPSVARETMAYDPGGKRVKHQTASETSKYVWDQENYLQETNASDVTQAVFTNEPRTYGNLISQRRSGATHYYVFDALGSTRLLTDSLEAISESLLYDAWGNLVGSSPSMAVLFRWVGELGYLFVPASGDYYVRRRTYSGTLGRWLSRDPLGPQLTFRSMYRYALMRPNWLTDASGLQIDWGNIDDTWPEGVPWPLGPLPDLGPAPELPLPAAPPWGYPALQPGLQAACIKRAKQRVFDILDTMHNDPTRMAGQCFDSELFRLEERSDQCLIDLIGCVEMTLRGVEIRVWDGNEGNNRWDGALARSKGCCPQSKRKAQGTTACNPDPTVRRCVLSPLLVVGSDYPQQTFMPDPGCTACSPELLNCSAIVLREGRNGRNEMGGIGTEEDMRLLQWCESPENLNALAELLLHEAIHMCTGGHWPTDINTLPVDPCGRPDAALAAHNVFENCG